MTAEEVAEILRCHPRTIARKVMAEGLPAIETGRTRLFDPADVHHWIEGRRRVRSAADATEPEAPRPTAIAGWDGVMRRGRKGRT